MRTELQSDLDGLEASFQEAGEIVLRAIRGAVDALRTQDVELCDEVIAFDDEIDDRYMAIENQIQLVLARQTPLPPTSAWCSPCSTQRSTSSASATDA